MQGFVVGFKGSQVFCLHYNSMQALEVPQSASMQGYLAAEDWDNAYKACAAFTTLTWQQKHFQYCPCLCFVALWQCRQYCTARLLGSRSAAMSKHESLVRNTASACYVSLLLEHSKLDAATSWSE